MAHRPTFRTLITSLSLIVLLAVPLISSLVDAAGAQLQNRYLKSSSSTAGDTAQYEFGFQLLGLDTIQLVELEICANDPFINTACTPPSGFDASSAVLIDQTGDVGFSISPQSTSNVIVLQRSPISSNGQQNTYTFSDIVNPDQTGSYYVRMQTFPDADLNGEANNYGAIAFVMNEVIDVQAEVPPYLLFCAGVTVNGMNCDDVVGDYVDFGEFSSRQASQGTTQFLTATNADDGYNVRVTGTTLTSGINIIPNLTGTDISRPGVSQFGMNLRANSSPQGGSDVVGIGNGLPTNGYDQINFYRFNSGDVVAASSAPDHARKYTATYVVNVSSGQSPGVYVSTLTYIALGSF